MCTPPTTPPSPPVCRPDSRSRTGGPCDRYCQCPHVSYCRADSCLFETTAHTDSSVLVTLDKNNEIGELKHSNLSEGKGFLILFFLFSVSGPGEKNIFYVTFTLTIKSTSQSVYKSKTYKLIIILKLFSLFCLVTHKCNILDIYQLL